MTVSVVIPTYRRSQTLGQALASLQEQTLPDFEIFVVDNAADKDVERQVADFNRTARRPVRYVPEPRLGLHHARHAGLRAASGEFLVFTDDDATFAPGWLAAYADAFAQHPTMMAAGGPSRPVWMQPPPQWLADYMGNATQFPILSLAEPHTEFRLDDHGSFYGVNMAFRRKALEDAGGFHPELIGWRTVGDGESGLNREFWKRGWLVGFVPGAVVHHHIPPSRMTVAYIRRWAWHLGGAEMFERWHSQPRTLASLAREAVRIARCSWRTWLRDFTVRSRTDRAAIETQFQASRGWCKLFYVWWMLTDPVVQQSLDQQEFLT
jgi:glycosyltransferase involved in cell wall biosynthesis